MLDHSLRRLLATAAMAAPIASCGMGSSGSNAAALFTADIHAISDAIATAAKYPTSAVWLTGGLVRLRFEVSDPAVAMADEVTRNNAATTLVAAAAQVLASHPEICETGSDQCCHHPSGAASAGGSGWRIEDVVKSRNGPNQRFILHTT